MLAVHTVDESNNDEDSEGNDEEIDDVLKEIAIGDMGDGVGTENIGDIKGEGGKIEATGKETGDRHNHIVHKGFNDGSKSATDGDTNSKVDNISAIDEFAKFFHESTFGEFFDGGRVCHGNIIAYL